MSLGPEVDRADNDANIIRQNFFRELCRQDKDVIEDGRPNIFTIEQIWRKSTRTFSLDHVILHVREYSIEPEPELEFVGRIDENRIRLTVRGRNIHCKALI